MPLTTLKHSAMACYRAPQYCKDGASSFFPLVFLNISGFLQSKRKSLLSLKTKVAVHLFSGHMPFEYRTLKVAMILSRIEFLLILQVETTIPGILAGFFMQKLTLRQSHF